MSAPAFGTTDILSLGADWEPQGHSPTTAPTRVTIPGPNGDIVASTTHNSITTGTVQYIYIGAETAFIAAFAAASCDVGDLVATNTKFITGIAIDYSPCAAGKRPIATFTYRTGPTTSPATPYVYVTTQVLPTYAAANVTVPSIFSVTLGSAEVQNAQWELSCQFGEDLNKDGAYLDGNGYNGEEKLDLTFAGIPTSVTIPSGFQQVSTGSGVSVNTGYNTPPYSYVRSVTRT